MVNWDDMGELTWDQMGSLTWDDVGRLSLAEIQEFVANVWPTIRDLPPEDRVDFADGLRNGMLPPALLASRESKYSKAQEAALHIWTVLMPQTKDQTLAYIAILIALLGLIPRDAPTAPPSVTVIVNELPEPMRPSPSPSPTLPTSGDSPAENA